MFKMVYDGLRQLLMLFDAKDPMLSWQFSNQPIEEVNWGLPLLLLQCPSTRRLWFWNFLSWWFPAFAPKPAGNCNLALTHIHIIYIIISLNYIFMYMYIIYIYIRIYDTCIHISHVYIYIYVFVYLISWTLDLHVLLDHWTINHFVSCQIGSILSKRVLNLFFLGFGVFIFCCFGK